MNGLESAVAQIADALERRRIPYMIIGGVAVFVWARSRLTRDVDVTVIVPPERQSEVVRDLVREFECQSADAEAFVAQTRVLPLRSSDGVAIDVIFGMLPYERMASSVPSRWRLAGVS